MIIFGVDPGTARIGWAVIEKKGNTIVPIAYDCILTSPSLPPEERLLTIFQKLTQLISLYKPQFLSVEELFFATNAKTAIAVGQARGIILLAGAQAHVPVVSYTPLVVKQTITGFGQADKRQVQRMIVSTMRLTDKPKLDDTADALAIALTHAYSVKLKGIIQ